MCNFIANCLLQSNLFLCLALASHIHGSLYLDNLELLDVYPKLTYQGLLICIIFVIKKV